MSPILDYDEEDFNITPLKPSISSDSELMEFGIHKTSNTVPEQELNLDMEKYTKHQRDLNLDILEAEKSSSRDTSSSKSSLNTIKSDLNLNLDMELDLATEVEVKIDKKVEPKIEIISSDINSLLDDSYMSETSKDTDMAEIDKMLANSKKFILPLVVITIIVVIIFSIKSAIGTKKVSKTVNTVPTTSNIVSPSEEHYKKFGNINILINPSLTINPVEFYDYIIITKQILLWENTTIPLVIGTTTKSKVDIKTVVTSDQYNLYKDGQILEVYFNTVKINNIEHVINVKLGEVIAK